MTSLHNRGDVSSSCKANVISREVRGENCRHVAKSGVKDPADKPRGQWRCLLSVEEVPEQFKEKYILTCYRKPYSSLLYCILSSLTLNNETFNIWTHLLPLIILSVHFYQTFPSKLYPLTAIPTDYYPFIAMELSVCTYLTFSTVAHTFNCMTPRIRHICFYVDYLAISMFGVGGTYANYYYIRPVPAGPFPLPSADVYIGVIALFNVVAVYLWCASRHRWEPVKYIIRTAVAMVIYMCGNFPSFLRLVYCLFGISTDDCGSSLPYLVMGWVTYFIAGALNASRVPERYYPKSFDVFGHNHQWFHLWTTLGTVSLFLAVQADLVDRKEQLPVLLEGVTVWSMGWILLTLFLGMGVVVWFGSQLERDGTLRACSKNVRL